jgi:hypothetical protein
LQTQPSLAATEASAALSHSTRPFVSATVDFDLWANDALVNGSEDVSWFRYVPMDGDDEHVVALVFRRGQAVLRSESHMEQTLSKLPRTDGRPSHITVHLDRRGPCRTHVELDGASVASSRAEPCTLENSAFVEFGVVTVGRLGAQLSAGYDDIAFTRE